MPEIPYFIKSKMIQRINDLPKDTSLNWSKVPDSSTLAFLYYPIAFSIVKCPGFSCYHNCPYCLFLALSSC